MEENGYAARLTLFCWAHAQGNNSSIFAISQPLTSLVRTSAWYGFGSMPCSFAVSLGFIHLYTRLHRRPPAKPTCKNYFRISPPAVHQMVLSLERAGHIKRLPRTPRHAADLNCLMHFLLGKRSRLVEQFKP